MSKDANTPDALAKATSAEEALTIRDQARDFETKQWLLASEKFVEQHHAERLKVIENTASYGSAFIKTLFLLNGTAIIAVLTFIGSLYSKADGPLARFASVLSRASLPALHWFTGGVVSIVLASGLGYLSWAMSVEAHWDPGKLSGFVRAHPLQSPSRVLRYAILCVLYAAVSLGFISVGCFVRGAVRMASVFSKVRIEAFL